MIAEVQSMVAWHQGRKFLAEGWNNKAVSFLVEGKQNRGTVPPGGRDHLWYPRSLTLPSLTQTPAEVCSAVSLCTPKPINHVSTDTSSHPRSPWETPSVCAPTPCDECVCYVLQTCRNKKNSKKCEYLAVMNKYSVDKNLEENRTEMTLKKYSAASRLSWIRTKSSTICRMTRNNL